MAWDTGTFFFGMLAFFILWTIIIPLFASIQGFPAGELILDAMQPWKAKGGCPVDGVKGKWSDVQREFIFDMLLSSAEGVECTNERSIAAAIVKIVHNISEEFSFYDVMDAMAKRGDDDEELAERLSILMKEGMLADCGITT
jgi:hypothetical protein